jgi:hypothetical protein
MISNPLTGRNIKIGGPTYMKLMVAGYILQDNVLVPQASIMPKKTLNPPFDIDVLPYIYSYLPFKDILNGYYVNRVFATAISHGFPMYTQSIISYMVEHTYPMMIMKQVKDILSDHDILMVFSKIPMSIHSPHYMNIVSIDIYMGRESRTWRLYNIYLLVKTGKDINVWVEKYGKQDSIYSGYEPPCVYNKTYLPPESNKYDTLKRTLDDRIMDGYASISDIQSACMKYGLLGYTKVNNQNKLSALNELRIIIKSSQ